MADMAPVVEVLDSRGAGDPGTDVPRGRRALLVWSAVLLVAVVAMGTAWSVDSRQRAREAAAVAGCEHHLRQASALSERRMGLLVNYVQPALRTTAGVQQLHLADLMAQRASAVLPAVERADAECRAVSVRPWHFSLVARRDAARAYSAAVVTLLQTVAAQGTTSYAYDAALVRLRGAAGVD